MDRPFVYINMAMSVDGKITSSAREYPRLTSALDRREMDRLRAEADAILVGAETIRSDNPWLHVRGEQMQDYRRSLGKPEGLLKIVLTRSLRLEPTSRFFEDADGGDRIVATVEEVDDERTRPFESAAEIWRIGRGDVDVRLLLQRLKARGVERLLVEGGGEVNGSLLSEDVVDEVYVTLAPALLGGRDAPTPFGGPGLTMKEQRRLRLVDQRREGDELYLRYTVIR